MQIYKCELSDIRQLAVLNLQLIEDEKSDNPMTVEELEERMSEFMNGDYNAYFYRDEGNTIGYALVRISSMPMYLRHFFVCREYRRNGCGKTFFGDLLKELGVRTIDIEVYSWNETGKRFWESLGFSPRCIYMRYQENV